MDAMSHALSIGSRSSFIDDIERALMPSRFTRLPFNSYDGKTDLVEHVSHYIQMMSLHAHNDALMCKVGYLKEFVVDSGNRGIRQGAQQRENPLPQPLRVIEVIHAAPRGIAITRRGVLIVAPVGNFPGDQSPEKKMRIGQEPITFNDDDLEGTIQLHDDVLVVAARIGDFLVKRVMVDQGCGADEMYLDLFKGLGLKNQDLSKYDAPMVGFDDKVVILEGQISLPVNMEGKKVVVTFIVVNSFSPYTAILGRPWIHAMGVVPSTLHVKVKFPTEQGIAVVRGSQQVARQCLVTAVNWKNERAKEKEIAEEAPL
ncbi:uncharacterized protein LOC115961647 [Quercus lobata]|uniref:uncharacterized protein LOC115961647 n=1 Tax=Quercus lobata TaxID=97700 RepID=UPI001244E166|nr:uncharacterized protein LOC115961647 [Quercus lobata]